MFGSRVIPAVTRKFMALTLAAGLAAGMSGTAHAAIPNAYLSCAEGTGMFAIELPIDATARMSYFAYRVDGGAWTSTPWYYTNSGLSWVLDWGRWVALPLGGGPGMWDVGGNRLVEGFEYRYKASTGTGSWISLGWCRTTSFFEGGIVVH